MSGRSTARPVRRASAARGVLLGVAIALLVAVLVAACGPALNVSTVPPGGSAPPAGGSPGPNPTRWPGGTVTAVVALGAADQDIATFLATYQAAVANSDVRAMWGAADGFVTTGESLLPNIDRLDQYPPTQALAAKYRASIPPAIAAAKKVRDAITAGDSASVSSASLDLITALQKYSELRAELADWVAQSAFQQKTLFQ